MNPNTGIAEENRELQQMTIRQLCADGHDDLAHSVTHLFSNLNSEIEQLQQENERITKERDGINGDMKSWRRRVDETQEVNKLLESELQQLREELEQTRQGRDKALNDMAKFEGMYEDEHADNTSLRSQLAEKDKVLEWYANLGIGDVGIRASSILYRYRQEEETK